MIRVVGKIQRIKKITILKKTNIEHYVDVNFGGNKAEFARYIGVYPHKINEWIRCGWIIVDNILYSPRKEIRETNENLTSELKKINIAHYVDVNFGGNRAEFARYLGVYSHEINAWIRGSWIVVDNILYSPKREIK